VGPPGAAVVAAAARKEASASAEGFDDSHFLGSIMGAPAHQHQHQHQHPPAVGPPVVVKRKRGRPPKNRDGAAPPPPPKPVKKREDDEDVVCFICFDGGNLVVCDKKCVCAVGACISAYSTVASISSARKKLNQMSSILGL
jgi:hypothetical protein